METPAHHLFDQAHARGMDDAERDCLTAAVALMDRYTRPEGTTTAYARSGAAFVDFMRPRGGLRRADRASVVGFMYDYGTTHGRTVLKNGDVVSSHEGMRAVRKGVADKLSFANGEYDNPARSEAAYQFEHAWGRRNIADGVESAGAVPMGREKREAVVRYAAAEAQRAWDALSGPTPNYRHALEAARNYALVYYLHATGARGGESGTKLRWKDLLYLNGELQSSLLGGKSLQTARAPPVAVDDGSAVGLGSCSEALLALKTKVEKSGGSVAPDSLIFALWDPTRKVYGNSSDVGATERPVKADSVTRFLAKLLAGTPGVDPAHETSHSFRRGCSIDWGLEGVSPETRLLRMGLTRLQTLNHYGNEARPTYAQRNSQNEERLRQRRRLDSADVPADDVATP